MKTVLVIDDKQDNLITIKAVIKSHIKNCEVITALSGSEGIKMAEEKLPDTILLDIIMPDMDGYKVCERLKADAATKHIPIVMVTAIKTDTESRIKGLNIGADAFLSKPVDPAELSAQLSVMFRIKEAEDKLRAEKNELDLLVFQRTKELRENEEKFKNAILLSPHPVMIHDEDNNVLLLSKGWTELSGYNIEDIPTLGDWTEKAYGNRNDYAQEYIEDLFNINTTVNNGEWIVSSKNEKKLIWEFTTTPLGKFGNNKKVLLSNAIDITERKKAEKKLLESKNRFKSLMQQAPFVVEVYDIDGLQISVNKAYEDMWGFPAETTVNKFNVLKSKEVVDSGLIDYVNRAYAGKAVTAPEYEFDPTGDTEAKGMGRVRWLSTRIYPLKDESGKVKNIVIIHQDITEKKYDKLLQRVIFNISNAVAATDNLNKLIGIIKDELGTIIDTSNFYVALYDKTADTFSFPYYTDEKDAFKTAPAQKTLSKYVIDTKKPLLANIALKKKFNEEGILDFQGSLSKIWLGVPLVINDVSIGAFAVQSYTDENAYNETDMKMLEFVSDQISLSIHRKIAEDKLKAALVKAEESDRLKTAFLANMSHEIRTPMNGILGFTDLLTAPGLDGDELKKYTKIIKRSGNRMLNIINNLIDISKIEAGQMKLFLSECNINTQMEYLYTFFNPEAAKKGLKFSFATPLPNKDVIIETDREKIYAILTNLIKNAIKYTKDGYIEFGYEKKGDILEFYVKDSGIGIPKNRQEAIFERFIQADIDDTQVYEGAGLGLAIITAYIDMLGGRIWVNSKENTGSQFYFTIPYKTNQKHKNAEQKKEHYDPVIPPKNLKILIAEDEYVADDLLTIILSKFSANIFHAKTGVETINIVKKNPDIDFILMDIKMPVMDGYTATRKIRKFNKDVKIIAQTAFALTGDRDKAIEAGCDDYISKPINRKELIKKINNLL